MAYNSKLAIENYSRVLVLVIGCWLLSTYLGDAPSVILLKVLLVPFFFVAKSGVRAFFNTPIVEGKFTVRSLEWYALIGIFEALTIVILFWKPEDSIRNVLAKLGLALAFFISLQMLSLYREIGQMRKNGVEK